MSQDKWVVLDEIAGAGQADILSGLLNSQGIPTTLSQEGAGHAFALTVGDLGRVQILVPSSSLEAARQILQDFYAGKYEEGTYDAGMDDAGADEAGTEAGQD